MKMLSITYHSSVFCFLGYFPTKKTVMRRRRFFNSVLPGLVWRYATGFFFCFVLFFPATRFQAVGNWKRILSEKWFPFFPPPTKITVTRASRRWFCVAVVVVVVVEIVFLSFTFSGGCEVIQDRVRFLFDESANLDFSLCVCVWVPFLTR